MEFPRHNPTLGQLGFAAVGCCCWCILSAEVGHFRTIKKLFLNFYFFFCQRNKSEGATWCNNQQCCVNMPELNVVKCYLLCRMVEAQTTEQDSLIIVKCLYSALKMRILPSFSGSKLGQSVPRIYISIKNTNNNTLCL